MEENRKVWTTGQEEAAEEGKGKSMLTGRIKFLLKEILDS